MEKKSEQSNKNSKMKKKLKFLNNQNGKFVGNEYRYLLECLDSKKKKKFCFYFRKKIF